MHTGPWAGALPGGEASGSAGSDSTNSPMPQLFQVLVHQTPDGKFIPYGALASYPHQVPTTDHAHLQAACVSDSHKSCRPHWLSGRYNGPVYMRPLWLHAAQQAVHSDMDRRALALLKGQAAPAKR